jgi:CRP/FNR family cyclic AMP-dependent transcriptional regulator
MTELVHVPIQDRLAGTWFAGGMDPEMRERLARLARIAHYQPGEAVLVEGALTTDLGVVLEGRVGLRLRVPERGPVTILTVEPGDLVGWSSLTPPHRSTSTAVALSPTELILIDGAALRAELATDAALAAAVYPRVLRAVSRRLEGTRLQLLDLFTAPGTEPW